MTQESQADLRKLENIKTKINKKLIENVGIDFEGFLFQSQNNRIDSGNPEIKY